MEQNVTFDQDLVTSDMAAIIGRYRASVQIYAETLRILAKNPDLKDYHIYTIESMIKRMDNLVTDAELRWENRGKREMIKTNDDGISK